MAVTIRPARPDDDLFLSQVLVEAAFWRPGRTPATVRSVLADPADGFIFAGGDDAVADWTPLQDRVHSLGRSVEDFGSDYVSLPGGGLGRVAADVDAWRQAGGTHVSVVTMGLGLDSANAHIDHLATVADALKPELTAS